MSHLDLRDGLRGVLRGESASRAAFEALFVEGASAGLSGGLLTALAARGERAEEIAAVVEILMSRVETEENGVGSGEGSDRERGREREEILDGAIDVCGTGGDGLNTFNISTAAAFVVAGAGVPVAKHGGRSVSSACGSADVLVALGVDIEMSREKAAAALSRAGITFLFAPVYHVAMKAVAPLRRELGIRTIFNLAGPLANPYRVTRQIVGVDRPERVPVLAAALAALGRVRVLVLSNEAGGDELLPFGVTRAAGLDGEAFELRPSDFGVAEGRVEDLRGGDAPANASIVSAVLAGEPGPRRDTVLMNAAAALAVAGKADDFRDGMSLAAESIDSGAAARALAALVEASR